MNPVFGIHIGNSSVCLALHKQDDVKCSVEVIANNAGERVMPASVTFFDNEIVVGTASKSLMVSRWNSTVTSYKLLFDKESPDNLKNNIRNAKVVLKDRELCYELNLETGVQYKTAGEIASCVYQSLYEMAKSVVSGEGEVSCVLMVPKHFNEATRFTIRTAAEAVGWDVLQVVTEPAAAILGYNFLSGTTPLTRKTVLVYRVGGRSCEATVMDLNYGMISILDSEYSEDIGGQILISSLTNYLADEFYKKYKLDPRENHRSLMKLTLAAENCLHILSTVESANCFVESLCEGVDLNYSMSRARFESVLFKYLPLFTKPINLVLSRMSTNYDTVSMVLLCGGVMKIPRLRKYITDIFQESCAQLLPLPSGMNYDEVLACGAANQAGYLAINNMKDTFLPSGISVNVLQSPLIVQIEGTISEGIEFPGGHPLPAYKNFPLQNSFEEKVTITFLQNQSCKSCLKGKVEMTKEDLGSSKHLRLGINSDFQISVAVTEGKELTFVCIVKMFESENVVCDNTG